MRLLTGGVSNISISNKLIHAFHSNWRRAERKISNLCQIRTWNREKNEIFYHSQIDSAIYNSDFNLLQPVTMGINVVCIWSYSRNGNIFYNMRHKLTFINVDQNCVGSHTHKSFYLSRWRMQNSNHIWNECKIIFMSHHYSRIYFSLCVEMNETTFEWLYNCFNEFLALDSFNDIESIARVDSIIWSNFNFPGVSLHSNVMMSKYCHQF